ncbi:MAG TPA: ABC transporter permease [Anaerolineaceae bacterium]|nr:ABC transporter permease [Anaerolineaceae bacterium]HPA33915.1 ABC transporter permease [Anaerolineaceae bacterium]HQH35191.1 ABC transporter permease [Anaerolineaceae bacterium]HQO98316.1 ABC transporter permease [Anaerolineaceae bacterium]HQP61761.1 ABC transporter permease [Anaerolineaceae bacterium]
MKEGSRAEVFAAMFAPENTLWGFLLVGCGMDEYQSSEESRSTWVGLAHRWRNLGVLVSLLTAILIWMAAARWSNLPAFILPPPADVWGRFLQTLQDGTLLRHTSTTLLEVLLGLLAGSTLATVLGYWLARSRLLEQIVAPYLVASQAIPIVAIAPLIIIWFKPGLFPKVLICALTVFFPILVNTVVGLRAVPENLRDLMRSLRASRGQMLRHLEIPAALPVFLGGLRVGATLSVIGAIVGEFVSADRGLGFLINVGRGQFDTALVFVAVFTLITLAVCLYGVVVLLERRLLRWQGENAF